MKSRKNMTESFVSLPFKDLKRALKKRRNKRVISREEKTLSEDELFEQAMKEVEEISEYRDISVCRKKFDLPDRKDTSDSVAFQFLSEIVDGSKPIRLSDTQEYVEWVNSDCGMDIIGHLHSGLYSVQDFLDLHGLSLDEADGAIQKFITESMRRGYRCVKIIHGRGLGSKKGPVLKQATVHWLSRRYKKYLIAFVTARQCDGGLGALYVLLK